MYSFPLIYKTFTAPRGRWDAGCGLGLRLAVPGLAEGSVGSVFLVLLFAFLTFSIAPRGRRQYVFGRIFLCAVHPPFIGGLLFAAGLGFAFRPSLPLTL